MTEGAVVFPMLLERDVRLGDAVDRLKAGHQDIARDVDVVGLNVTAVDRAR